jgi:expansin (peptidoglycan-binding protein)
VASLWLQRPDGSWLAGTRTSDNYFTFPNLPPSQLASSLNVRLSSVFEEVVTDTLPQLPLFAPAPATMPWAISNPVSLRGVKGAQFLTPPKV